MMEKMKTIFPFVILVGTSVVASLLIKFQNKTIIGYDRGRPIFFYHPLFQAISRMFGEALCLPVYFLFFQESSQKQPPFNLWISLGLCILTYSEKALQLLSFATSPMSVVHTLSTSLILFTAVISYFFLGRRYSLKKCLSLALIVVGLIIVGNSVVGKGRREISSLGILAVLTAQFCHAIYVTSLEKISEKRKSSSLKYLGIEGFMGAGLGVFIAYGMQFVKCEPDDNTSYCFSGTIEDLPFALHSLLSTPSLILTLFGLLICYGINTAFASIITQRFSAIHKVTMGPLRTTLTWIINSAIGWDRFMPMQVLGYVIAVCGVFIFHEILRPEAIIPKIKSK